MRLLLWVIAILAALYGGYWFVGSRAVERGAVAAMDGLKAEGRAAYGSLSVTGFPSRFDMTIEPIALTLPEAGLTWEAPFLQLFTLSYKPNHVIAVWPHEQRLTIAGVPVEVKSTDMRASAVAGTATDLPLLRTTLVAQNLELKSGNDPRAVTAEEARLASRRTDADGRVHRIGIEFDRLTPAPALRAIIDPAGELPPQALRLRLDADLELDRPVDRFAATTPPRPEGITLHAFNFDWGPVSLSATGSLRIRPDGTLDGHFDIASTRWRTVLSIAVAAGALHPDVAATYAAALAKLAQAGGDPDRIAVPLEIRGGWMTLGPLPLGFARRF